MIVKNLTANKEKKICETKSTNSETFNKNLKLSNILRHGEMWKISNRRERNPKMIEMVQ